MSSAYLSTHPYLICTCQGLLLSNTLHTSLLRMHFTRMHFTRTHCCCWCCRSTDKPAQAPSAAALLIYMTLKRQTSSLGACMQQRHRWLSCGRRWCLQALLVLVSCTVCPAHLSVAHFLDVPERARIVWVREDFKHDFWADIQRTLQLYVAQVACSV